MQTLNEKTRQTIGMAIHIVAPGVGTLILVCFQGKIVEVLKLESGQKLVTGILIMLIFLLLYLGSYCIYLRNKLAKKRCFFCGSTNLLPKNSKIEGKDKMIQRGQVLREYYCRDCKETEHRPEWP